MGGQRAPTRRDAVAIYEPTDLFPALHRRKQAPLDAETDLARRELWRAFQRGRLTEEELASTLDRLEGAVPTG